VLYIVAMVAYAADLGFRRRPADAETGAEVEVETKTKTKAKVEVKVAAGVGGRGGADAAAVAVDDRAAAAAGSGAADADDASQRREVDWARLAVVLNVLGWGAHLGVLVTRAAAAGRWPWANMYEFLTAIAFAAVTAFLIVMWRSGARFLGAFVMLAAVVALGVANIWLYDSVGPVVPALNSYWIAIHVSAAIVATGAFTVAGAATVLYMLKSRREAKGGAAEGVWARIPATGTLDRLAFRVTTFAFPIWTTAIIMGAVWADEAWGRYWGWDPKEIWSFVTWIGYAAYLHARATAGWKGRRAAVLSLVAFAALLFNFFGVNYMFSGLHSYA